MVCPSIGSSYWHVYLWRCGLPCRKGMQTAVARCSLCPHRTLLNDRTSFDYSRRRWLWRVRNWAILPAHYTVDEAWYHIIPPHCTFSLVCVPLKIRLLNCRLFSHTGMRVESMKVMPVYSTVRANLRKGNKGTAIRDIRPTNVCRKGIQGSRPWTSLARNKDGNVWYFRTYYHGTIREL